MTPAATPAATAAARATVPCPHVHVGGLTLPAFKVCGVTGFAAGITLAIALAAQRSLSLTVVLAEALAIAAGFLTLAMATKVVTGEESLTFYHHAVTALAVGGVTAAAFGAPVAAHLDLTALGIATFLVAGRVGCLLVGCCHGRPSSRGLRYGAEHAAEGFPPYLVGVRLFPLPAVEAGGSLLAVVALTTVWIGGATPGTVLAAIAVTYAFGRFLLEFARGDADRHYAAGFSEAQWTSLAVTVAVAGAAWTGALPWHPLLAAAPNALAAAFVTVAVARRRRPVRRDLLTHPRHVRELAVAAEHAVRLWRTGGPPPGRTDLPVNQVPIGGTSLGVLLSAGDVDTEVGRAVHYAFSHAGGDLAPAAAGRIATLLLRLRHDDGRYLLLEGGHGVTHLVVAEDAVEDSVDDAEDDAGPRRRSRRAVAKAL